MKQLFILSAIITLLSSCKHRGHLERIDIVLLIDNTDVNRLIPDGNSVLKLYNFNTQRLCYEAYYKQTMINDLNINQANEEYIPNEKIGENSNLIDDPLFRKKEVVAFRDRVFNDINQVTLLNFSERPESKVYETICNELEELSQHKSFRKYLIISSDLCENSELWNSYTQSFIRIIKEDRQKAKERLIQKFVKERKMPKNLKGTTVYILFNPKTKQEDIRFNFFQELYRDMLERRGAKVYVKSINTIKNYEHE